MKNRYIKRSRMSEEKTLQMLQMFAMDVNATLSAKYIDLGLKTTKIHFAKIRERINESNKEKNNELLRQFGIDPGFTLSNNSYKQFQPATYKRFKVLAIHYADGNEIKVLTDVLSVTGKTVIEDIKNHLKHLLIRDKKIIDFGFADFNFIPTNEVNSRFQSYIPGLAEYGILTFWQYAKKRTGIFYGIGTPNFIYHLKEAEWRYNKLNGPEKNIYSISTRKRLKKTKDSKTFTIKEKRYYGQWFQDILRDIDVSKFEIELKNILEANPL